MKSGTGDTRLSVPICPWLCCAVMLTACHAIYSYGPSSADGPADAAAERTGDSAAVDASVDAPTVNDGENEPDGRLADGSAVKDGAPDEGPADGSAVDAGTGDFGTADSLAACTTLEQWDCHLMPNWNDCVSMCGENTLVCSASGACTCQNVSTGSQICEPVTQNIHDLCAMCSEAFTNGCCSF